jgi:hypothetical protein
MVRNPLVKLCIITLKYNLYLISILLFNLSGSYLEIEFF